MKRAILSAILSTTMAASTLAAPPKPYHEASSQMPQPMATAVYIPHAYDVVPELRTESACCFRLSSWLLQPVSVISPLAAAVFVALGQYYAVSSPGLASAFSLVGMGFSVAGFVTNVLMIKVNDKLENIDRYVQAELRARERIANRHDIIVASPRQQKGTE